MHRLSRIILSIALVQYISAQLLPENAPQISKEGQTGTNQCGTQSRPKSMCQNAYVNSLTDFCLWGPSEGGPNSDIGHTERNLVSWCLVEGHGTRVMPADTIKGAHFIQTPDFVQITGIGNLSKINIPANDSGGEIDPHGADGLGNPLGGLVFSAAFGQMQQIQEWTSFISGQQFCFRACKPGPNAWKWCQHIYDIMGCAWNMPGDYSLGFNTCKADSGEPAGIYGTSTFYQGQPKTPSAHPRPSASSCTIMSVIQTQAVISPTPTATPVTATRNGVASPTGSSSSDVANKVKNFAPVGTSTSGALRGGRYGWEPMLFVMGSATIGSMLGVIFIL